MRGAAGRPHRAFPTAAAREEGGGFSDSSGGEGNKGRKEEDAYG